MPASIIDGTEMARQIRADVTKEIAERLQAGKPAPGLATVLVGDDPASHDYVRSKHKACAEAGIQSFGNELPANATQKEVQNLVKKLNDDPAVNGILVQLPLPKGLDEESILSQIDLAKDVDGFHPINVGRLAQKGRDPLFVPCTPAGCMVMLEKYCDRIEGKNAVVLGRSNIVGMPVALLLIRANATVTICHSRSKDLPGIIREADILVAAVGRPEMVRGDWIKPGAVIIDVGINHVDDATKKKGYRLVGDVKFDEAVEVAGAITPVPGGVGPMTIAMLLRSTLQASKLAHG
jgi:methylenetetrahydrofolate dehydrogenase (NADP+) / methenyltetrahydrofolate cyclohydrolase